MDSTASEIREGALKSQPTRNDPRKESVFFPTSIAFLTGETFHQGALEHLDSASRVSIRRLPHF